MKLKTKLSKLRHDGHITDAEYAVIINVLNKFSTQPPKTQPCEDCISRAEAIRVAEQGQIQGYEWQFKKLCTLPPVTPKQSTGKWIIHPKGGYAHLVCSKCLSDAPFDCKTNFCPNCGSRMIEPQESESDD